MYNTIATPTDVTCATPDAVWSSEPFVCHCARQHPPPSLPPSPPPSPAPPQTPNKLLPVTPIDPDEDTITRDDAGTCNAALNALQCSEWAAAKGFTFSGTVHTSVVPPGCYRVAASSGGAVVFNTNTASTTMCNVANVEYCICARYKAWMLPNDRCIGRNGLGAYPYGSRSAANQACLDHGCTGLADSTMLDEPEFSWQHRGGGYSNSGSRCYAGWYLRYHTAGTDDNRGIYWMGSGNVDPQCGGSPGYHSWTSSAGGAACVGCPAELAICSPPPSPPPPSPIQPLQLQAAEFCARGTVTAAECQARARSNPFNQGAFATRPSGCHYGVSNLGTRIYYYNYLSTAVACSFSNVCICAATDLHALADLSFQTTLTVAANTRTRIYHRQLSDGGLLEAGDTVRYVPTTSLADGSTSCPQWSAYALDDPNVNGQGFAGVLQGDNGIYLDVNLPDLDGSDTEAEMEFCYMKTSRRRKLQAFGSPPAARGGGLLVVTLKAPPYVYALEPMPSPWFPMRARHTPLVPVFAGHRRRSRLRRLPRVRVGPART